MTSKRVGVVLTLAQVDALRELVDEAQTRANERRRWTDAAEVTAARRRLHSATMAVEAMALAIAQQSLRREQRRQARREATAEGGRYTGTFHRLGCHALHDPNTSDCPAVTNPPNA